MAPGQIRPREVLGNIGIISWFCLGLLGLFGGFYSGRLRTSARGYRLFAAKAQAECLTPKSVSYPLVRLRR
jgi:hypothetical protein